MRVPSMLPMEFKNVLNSNPSILISSTSRFKYDCQYISVYLKEITQLDWMVLSVLLTEFQNALNSQH